MAEKSFKLFFKLSDNFGIDQGQPTMNTFPSKKQHGSGSGRKLKKKETNIL